MLLGVCIGYETAPLQRMTVPVRVLSNRIERQITGGNQTKIEIFGGGTGGSRDGLR